MGLPMDSERYQTVLQACALMPDLQLLPAGDQTEIGRRNCTTLPSPPPLLSLSETLYNPTVPPRPPSCPPPPSPETLYNPNVPPPPPKLPTCLCAGAPYLSAPHSFPLLFRLKTVNFFEFGFWASITGLQACMPSA